MKELILRLSNIDELETWKFHTQGYDKSTISSAYKKAVPLWVHRMLDSGKLLLNPEISDQLELQNWVPNDVQKRMIWASILGTDESPQRKERMYLIKEMLINRYGRDWWEDVFRRKNNVYAAKERIKKKLSGAAMNTFVTKTFLGADCAADEKLKALKMIPKD
jgi:hypothetical protein